MERLPDECYEDFKKRRREEKIKLKKYLKGESQYTDDCLVKKYTDRKGNERLKIKPGEIFKSKRGKFYKVGKRGNMIRIDN